MAVLVGLCQPAIAAPEAASLQLDAHVERETLPDGQAAALAADAGVPAASQAALTFIGYRLWAASGRHALGLGLDASSVSLQPPGPGGPEQRLVQQGLGPVLSIAWRMRLGERSTVYADTSTLAALSDGDEATYYRARGGIEWKLRESRFGFDAGRLSLQLDSGYRMSFRIRGGGLAIMLRGKF